MFVIYAPYLMV